MRYILSFILTIFFLAAFASAETVQVGSTITKELLEMKAGESDYVDVYVYNLGDVDVRINLRLDNLPEMVTSFEPNEIVIMAEKTKTPQSSPDRYWYLMEDGETYAPGRKIRFLVHAPHESDTLYTGIFSGLLAIEAHTLDVYGDNVRAAIGYEQDYAIKVHLLSDPLPTAKDINLSYGEKPVEQEERQREEQDKSTEYTPLKLNISAEEPPYSKERSYASTLLIILSGIAIIFYLIKR